MLDAGPTEAAAATASVDTGFDTTPVTATVSPAPEAAASATADAGFGDLGAPVQPSAPTANAVAGTSNDPDADLDARAGGLLANTSATDWNAISAFMRAVVPWPASEQDAGYTSIWYGFSVPDKPQTMFAGWPYKDIGKFMAGAKWCIDHFDRAPAVYFCTSLQSKIGKNKKGKNVARKSAADALALKAIWIDVDVRPNDMSGKHYVSFVEAGKAIDAFVKKHGLPHPTIVHSGGGFHVYWISDKALTPSEWHSYASGLKALLLQDGIKCDHGLTTDAARILRLPGSVNRKNPLNQVEVGVLKNFPVATYDFKLLDFLKQHATEAAPKYQSKSVFAEGVDPAIFTKPSSVFPKVDELSLSAGLERLVDFRPIFSKGGCPMYRDALKNSGAGLSQPLWHLQILGTIFMENGNAIAHEISKGHSGYTPDGTDEMFSRKMADRDAYGIGYPSCAQFKSDGSAACEGCPLFKAGKSPLNIRPDVTGTANSAAGDAPKPELSFVDPYAEFVGPEFPLEILPPTLANFVKAEHRAMGADPSAIAMAALTAVSGAIHAETRIRVGEGWPEKPILWTVLVGQPSAMKSPIIDKVVKPLSSIDHERQKLWSQEYAMWSKDKTTKKAPAPEKPSRCVINDSTSEKVAELLSRGPSGSLMVHDELAGWLGSFERYNSGSSRAFALSGWNGGTFVKDRVGRGKQDTNAEIRVENLALCVLGGIQPDRLAKLGDLTSDGLLQRFLTVLMKSAERGDQYHPVATVEAEYEKLIRSIVDAPPQNHHFEDEAFEVRDRMFDYLHRLEMVDGFPPSLIGAIGKLRGYFARICLVLHVAQRHENTALSEPLDPSFTAAAGEQLRKLFGVSLNDSLSAGINVSSAISRRTAEAAERLVREFLLPNCFGFYDVVVNGGQEREKLRSIADFILTSDKTRLRPSDFTAGVRKLRGEPEQKIRDWVGRFCGMDWLVPEEARPGAPPNAWQVVPGLREHFAERRKQAQAARAEAHAILKAGGSRGSGRRV